MEPKPIKCESNSRSVLTRDEYLRLLITARKTGRYRLYLLIKLFSLVDISIHTLNQVTVEAIKTGEIPGRKGKILSCPSFLQDELLEYAATKGIHSGPIFVTRTGEPLDRSNIHRELKSISKQAHIPSEKINTRTLHDLYQYTQIAVSEQANILTKMAYDQLLATEQSIIGWNRNSEIPG